MKRTIAVVSVAAALLFGAANVAGAETATGGTPRTSEGPNIDGAGTEVSEATADGATGALEARAEAVGGDSILPVVLRGFLPPNLIPGQGPSTAAANAGVDRSFTVEPGTYEVTITFDSAEQEEIEAGRATAAAYVQTSAAFPGDTEPAIAFDELPDEPGTVERTFVVEVPEGADRISVSATAVALSSADGEGNAADTRASVEQTTISVDAA
ncbi:hypothetical protein [Iamia sp.]|uniref:hypothetical protein n=1 Tax=Iamia sp. TaxID=2722710 RepID=UPI002BC996F6|nr:hypothetical protein [Iamia sp.]HXH58036.1 hypothetical protein [Iamia sp.]